MVLRDGPCGFAETAGRHAGDGAEYLGKIVVVADSHLLRDGGDGKAALHQKTLGGTDAPLGNEIGQGVPAGQQEAGLVLGMTKRQIFFKITLLQMIKRIVPPMSNEIITLVKDTSLARVVALQEVIWMGESFMKGNQGYAGLVWPLFFTAVYYLVFSGVATILLGKLEKKLEYFR